MYGVESICHHEERVNGLFLRCPWRDVQGDMLLGLTKVENRAVEALLEERFEEIELLDAEVADQKQQQAHETSLRILEELRAARGNITP